MNVVSLSTESLPTAVRTESWREFICKMIHNVSVEHISQREFGARISARRHGDISCASFWTKAHTVCGRREALGTAGASGYLVSWQIEGEAQITQEEQKLVVRPGEVAIIDGRRPMSVCFPGDVRRVVANLPARAVERSLPMLLRWHTLVIQPSGPFASILSAYLTELSSGHQNLRCDDAELLADNICNLLRVTSQYGAAQMSTRDLQREAVLRYVRHHACNADLSLGHVAANLNMSRRLVQKLLQESDNSFTELLLAERLELAARQLRSSSTGQISGVAYFCGFNDVSHFNHAFKQRFGMTPSEMRSRDKP